MNWVTRGRTVILRDGEFLACIAIPPQNILYETEHHKYIVRLSPLELHRNVTFCQPVQGRDASSSIGWQILNIVHLLQEENSY